MAVISLECLSGNVISIRYDPQVWWLWSQRASRTFWNWSWRSIEPIMINNSVHCPEQIIHVNATILILSLTIQVHMQVRVRYNDHNNNTIDHTVQSIDAIFEGEIFILRFPPPQDSYWNMNENYQHIATNNNNDGSTSQIQMIIRHRLLVQ